MDRHPERIVPVASTRLGRQLLHAHEHRRHPLAVGDRVALDQRQRLFGIEVLHDHRGAAEAHHGHVEAQGGCVIQRRGRKVDRVAAQAVQLGRDHHERARRVDRFVEQFGLHTLGPPRSAGGIEHVPPGGLVRDSRRRLRISRGLPGGMARQHAVHRVARANRGAADQQFGGSRGEARRDDQHLGPAVGEDVLGLLCRKARAHRGEKEARALRREADLEVAGVVVHHQRDRVAALQAEAAEKVRALVGAGLELPVGHGLAGARHDVSGLVGRGERVMARVEHWFYSFFMVTFSILGNSTAMKAACLLISDK